MANSMKRIKQAILRDAEVAAVSDSAVEFLRSNLGAHPLFNRREVERTVRLLPLGARCSEARERMGSSVKDVAQQLRVPQYRVRAIEAGSLRQIRLKVLQEYIALLGLQRWYSRWRRANVALLTELEGTEASEPRRGRTRG